MSDIRCLSLHATPADQLRMYNAPVGSIMYRTLSHANLLNVTQSHIQSRQNETHNINVKSSKNQTRLKKHTLD